VCVPEHTSLKIPELDSPWNEQNNNKNNKIKRPEDVERWLGPSGEEEQ
jgi:hypothetical protein